MTTGGRIKGNYNLFTSMRRVQPEDQGEYKCSYKDLQLESEREQGTWSGPIYKTISVSLVTFSDQFTACRL